MPTLILITLPKDIKKVSREFHYVFNHLLFSPFSFFADTGGMRGTSEI
jgi:hypothetical protein